MVRDDPALVPTHSQCAATEELLPSDPSISTVFEPLPAETSLTVVAMACRQLAAYFEDEVGTPRGFGKAYGFRFDPHMFKEFWEKSAREIEDLGEFIRESIEEWARQKKKKPNEPEEPKKSA